MDVRVEEKVEENPVVDVEMGYLHKSHHLHCHYGCSELDRLQYLHWMCGLRLPLIFAAYVLNVCVHTTFHVPHFLHPAEAAVEPDAHSAKNS